MSIPTDPILRTLLNANRQWAADVTAKDPNFFRNSAEKQEPKILWIGCSDSRVPESVILARMPGAIFTQRNIANQVHLDDYNVQSVLTYAIAELGVEHIIVAGHTRCGGVAVCVGDHVQDKAACFNPVPKGKVFGATEPRETSSWPPPPPLDTWLADLRHLAESFPTPPTVLELVQANVQMQVNNVVASKVVQDAWRGAGRSKLVGVHGWMYQLENGLVVDLDMSVYAPGHGPAGAVPHPK